MLRVLIILFSFYILMLTLSPCADRDGDVCGTSHQTAQNDSRDNHHDVSHQCSPFCTCSCCAVPVITSTHSVDFTCHTVVSEIINFYTSNYCTSVYASIWQPPQLG